MLVVAVPLLAFAVGTVKEIDTERDITLNGVDASDFAGRSIASGDINNDGVEI